MNRAQWIERLLRRMAAERIDTLITLSSAKHHLARINLAAHLTSYRALGESVRAPRRRYRAADRHARLRCAALAIARGATHPPDGVAANAIVPRGRAGRLPRNQRGLCSDQQRHGGGETAYASALVTVTENGAATHS
jgi:hypothetical protein